VGRKKKKKPDEEHLFHLKHLLTDSKDSKGKCRGKEGRKFCEEGFSEEKTVGLAAVDVRGKRTLSVSGGEEFSGYKNGGGDGGSLIGV